MPWWTDRKIRMIQNNQREIDVLIDPKKYAQTLKDFGANVAMIGCGGISALYPTELPNQRVSPFLKSDFIGEMVQACHDQDIRVIVRFDISKVDEKLIDIHPDWLVRNDNGEFCKNHGLVGACANGPYFQVRLFEILKEVFDRYPIDGIFFNAFNLGYWDYDGNRHPICRCDNCKKRFKEYSGFDLPKAVNDLDPVYVKYREFSTYCMSDLLVRVIELARSYSPEIAVSTYNNTADLIRNESNSAVDRPLPFWIYQSSDNAAAVMDTFEGMDKLSCNVVINSVDIFARFMGVSPELTKIRLLGDLACGAALDWCIVGDFDDYPDRKAFPVVKEVFSYHKRYEDYFTTLRPDAKILLVRGRNNVIATGDMEYRGIFKMLKESHRIFRIVQEIELDLFANRLDEFDAIFIPGIELDETSAFVKALFETKARVIATGLSFQRNPGVLQKLFGVKLGEPLKKTRAHYLLTEPKSVFKHFADQDWVYLDMEYRPMELDESNKGLLPLVLSAPHGPCEISYGYKVSDTMSISVKDDRRIYIPFMIGTLYYQHGFIEFKNLTLDVLDSVGGAAQPFTTNAPDCVEMFWHRCGDGKYMLQLLNLSGFNGITVGPSLPIHDIEVNLGINPSRVTELGIDGECNIECVSGALRIPVLGDYKSYVIE